MRTTKALLCAAAVAAGAVSAMAQSSNVYSLNVVGYVNRALPGTVGGVQQLAFIANPLDSGNNTYSNVLQALPVNSTVSRWNYSLAKFDTATRVSFGAGWTPTGAGTNTINPGEGVFVKLPLNSTGTNITFVGNVLQGSLTNTFLPGLTLQSYQVPVSDSAAAIGISGALPGSPSGSKLMTWNEGLQKYDTYTRVTFGAGWTPSVPTNVVGNSFFINNAATTNRDWIQTFTVQ